MYILLCSFDSKWRVYSAVQYNGMAIKPQVLTVFGQKLLAVMSIIAPRVGSFVSPRKMVLNTIKRFSCDAEYFAHCYSVFGERVLTEFDFADIDEVQPMSYDIQFVDGSIGFLDNGNFTVVSTATI